MAEEKETFTEFSQSHHIFPGKIMKLGYDTEYGTQPLCPHNFNGRSAWVTVQHGRMKLCTRCSWMTPNLKYRPKWWEIFLFKVAVKFLHTRGFFDLSPEMRQRFFVL